MPSSKGEPGATRRRCCLPFLPDRMPFDCSEVSNELSATKHTKIFISLLQHYPKLSQPRKRIDALCFTTSTTSERVQRDLVARRRGGGGGGNGNGNGSECERVHRPPLESRRRILQVARRRLPRRLKFTFPFRLQFSAPPPSPKMQTARRRGSQPPPSEGERERRGRRARPTRLANFKDC